MNRRSLLLTAAIVVVVLLGGALWFANRSQPAAAKAGDCVTAPLKGGYKTVGCDAKDAAFKVTAVLPNGDGNGCDTDPKVIMAVVDKDRTKTLCLGSAK